MVEYGEAIPHVKLWSRHKTMCADMSDHACYFCKPDYYPTMEEGCTLCSRCGVLIYTAEDDLMNEAMILCEKCYEEMMGEYLHG